MFDPELHEAMSTQDDSNVEPGTILNVFQNIRKYAQNGTRAVRSHKNITPPFYFLNPEGQVHRFST